MSFPFRSAKSAAQSLLFLFILIFSASRVNSEQVKNLKPQGYVNDFAGVLSAQAKEKLTALCAEVDQKTKAQIAVVTVSSLEGEPIEQYSIDLATQWGVGPKQQARGVLILLAPNDRKYRIEVGYGLEPILPDGKVGGFGREAVPLLRQGDYRRGGTSYHAARCGRHCRGSKSHAGYTFRFQRATPFRRARNSIFRCRALCGL